MQDLLDRYFFAERSRLQRAMVKLGEAMTAQVDLQTVVQKAMRKHPSRRYQNAVEVVDDLDAVLGFRPISARPGTSSRDTARAFCWRLRP